jgi:hypothetical protein
VRNDLAADRVAQQGGALQPDRIHPGSERVRQLRDVQGATWLAARTEARQVGGVDADVRRQPLGERDEVAAGHADAVNQDDTRRVHRGCRRRDQRVNW